MRAFPQCRDRRTSCSSFPKSFVPCHAKTTLFSGWLSEVYYDGLVHTRLPVFVPAIRHFLHAVFLFSVISFHISGFGAAADTVLTRLFCLSFSAASFHCFLCTRTCATCTCPRCQLPSQRTSLPSPSHPATISRTRLSMSLGKLGSAFCAFCGLFTCFATLVRRWRMKEF